jgi:ribosomal subunit interface protein
MNYNIKGTGLAVTDELRDYIEKRLVHANKFLENDPTAHLDVELQYTEGSQKGKYRAEFTASASSKVFRASEWGSTMHEAIDLCVAEFTNEVRREKKQKLRVFRHSAVRVKEFLRGWRKKV